MADSFLSSLENMPSWNEYKTFALKTQANNNAWSAQQAQKQMDFQAQMANTAHQREVADLKAAGLNPVLSAGGSGASAPSGAAAQSDNSVLQSITSYLMQQNQNLVQLEAQRVSAVTAKETAQIHAQAQLAAAATAAAASRYAADKNYQLQIELASKYPQNMYGTLAAILNGDKYNGKGIIDRAKDAFKSAFGSGLGNGSANSGRAFSSQDSSLTKIINSLNPNSAINQLLNKARSSGISSRSQYQSILSWMRSSGYFKGGSYTFMSKDLSQMDALERAMYDFWSSLHYKGGR